MATNGCFAPSSSRPAGTSQPQSRTGPVARRREAGRKSGPIRLRTGLLPQIPERVRCPRSSGPVIGDWYPTLKGTSDGGTAASPYGRRWYLTYQSYARTLVLMLWPYSESLTVQWVFQWLQAFTENLPSSPPAMGLLLGCQGRPMESASPCLREKRSQVHTMPPCGSPCTIMRDHEEVGQCAQLKSISPHTSTARKTTAKKHPPKKADSPAAKIVEDNQQCPRCIRRAENTFPPGLGEEISGLRPQDSDSEYSKQKQRVPVSSQAEERDNQMYWMVWSRWPGTWDPQE